jgi:hypothetical protein
MCEDSTAFPAPNATRLCSPFDAFTDALLRPILGFLCRLSHAMWNHAERSASKPC